MADLHKFYRVTDLFTRGKELVIGTGDDAMVLWIARLNSFERSEAQKDGSAARAKRLTLLREGDEEAQIIENHLAEHTQEDLVEALIGIKSNENYVRALDDIRTDKEWREKIEVLERGNDLIRDEIEPDGKEIARISELNVEYMEEIDRRQNQYEDQQRAEYENMDRDELAEEYRVGVKGVLGSNAFLEEMRISEMYYAVRDCNSPVGPPFNHDRCDHSVRLIPSRADVRRMPDMVITAIRDMLMELNMPLREAGNSAAPRSSSASSERQDVAEESTVSTPSET